MVKKRQEPSQYCTEETREEIGIDQKIKFWISRLCSNFNGFLIHPIVGIIENEFLLRLMILKSKIIYVLFDFFINKKKK